MPLQGSQQTSVAQGDGDSSDGEETEEEKLTKDLTANLGKLLADDGSRTYNASLDVRLSSALRVDRMIGVAEAPLASSPTMAEPVTDNYCRLTTTHPQRSVTLFLEQVSDGPVLADEKYAYMQLVVYHVEARGGGLPHEVVGRVHTHRFELTNVLQTYVSSADAKTVAVMVSKLHVLRCVPHYNPRCWREHGANHAPLLITIQAPLVCIKRLTALTPYHTVMYRQCHACSAMKLSDETMEESHAELDKTVGSIAKGCAPVTGMAVVPPPSGLGALFSYIVPTGGGAVSRPSAALTNQLAQFPSVRTPANQCAPDCSCVLRPESAAPGVRDRVCSGRSTSQNLEHLPFWCFMLRRGPLLGPILQHPDDIVALRQAFLSCSFAVAMGLISPQLYFATAPPHDFTPVGLAHILKTIFFPSSSYLLPLGRV